MQGSSHFANEIGRLRRRELLKLAAATGAGAFMTGPGAQRAPAYQPPAANRKSRAIVIGVNDYELEGVTRLENPVRDACRFARWLIEKGQVDRLDMTLLTSRAPTAEEEGGLDPDGKIERGTAKYKSIEKTIERFHCKAGAEGERLFFYFSGHGLMYEPPDTDGGLNAPEGDGFVPSDFGDRQPISTQWLVEYFENTDFVEQFYFFDACRTIGQSVLLARPLARPNRTPLPPKPWQYMLFSAAPGEVTKDRTGHFTERLLAVLNEGAGVFVDYDSVKKKFLVSFDQLCHNVQKWLDTNCQEIGQRDGLPICQRSEMRKRPFDVPSQSPCLIELTTDQVKKRALTLNVMPAAARNGATVTIRQLHDLKTIVNNAALPTNAAYANEVLPVPHLVTVNSPSGVAEGFIDLKMADKAGDFNLSVSFDAPPPADGGAFPISATEKDGTVQQDAPPETPTALNGGGPPVAATVSSTLGGSGTIAIFAPSPLAEVELRDLSGNAVPNSQFMWSSALGSLEVKGLTAGIYKAHTTFDGHMIERVVAVDNDARKTVEFQPYVLGTTGPLQFEPAAVVAVQSIAEEGDAYEAVMVGKGLGLKTFPQGVRVILGVDLDSPNPGQAGLGQIQLSLGGLDSDEFVQVPAEPCHVEGVATFTVPHEPGPYRIRIRRTRNDRVDVIDLATVVVANHLSQLNIEQSSTGRFRISQFAPPGGDAAKPSAEAVVMLDQVQRDIHRGGSQRMPLLLRALLDADRPELIAHVLAVYVSSLRLPGPVGDPHTGTPLGDSVGLPAEVIDRLFASFPEVPDGHVALAQALERSGEIAQAIVAYRDALSFGFPILSPFLSALADAVRRYEIPHSRRDLLLKAADAKIPGLIWSAWRPQL